MLFVHYGKKNDLMASEMAFENVNGRRTDAGCVYILYANIVRRDILICSILVNTCVQGLYYNFAVNLLYMSSIERTNSYYCDQIRQ